MVASDPDDRYIVLAEGRTDPSFGKEPSKRDVPELLRKGAILLDKPRGPTSHQVAAWLKAIVGVEKAGHLGTLDPKTTGVLPIALGTGVRSLQATLQEGKEYVALALFHHDPDPNELRMIASEFTGEIYQLVPVRAAVKRGLRTRRVHYNKVLEIRGREALMLVGCDSGTYIRTLVHDIGEVLGVGAHMAELRRTRSGSVNESQCVTLQQVKDAFDMYRSTGDEGPLRQVLHPMEVLLERIPQILVKDTSVDALCHGAPLGMPGILSVDRRVRKGEPCAVMTLKGEAVALAEPTMDAGEIARRKEGEAAKVTKVLMDTNVYPRSWKRHRE